MDLLKKFKEVKSKVNSTKDNSNWKLFNDLVEVYFSEEWDISQEQIRAFRRYEYALKQDLGLVKSNTDER